MGVGKSSLLSKYVKGVVPVSPLPTIAIEFATKIIQIKEGGYIKAQIWDTAGQEKYKAITSHHYRRAVGALIVYDVTKRSSFDNVLKWFSDLKSKAEKECIIALIGNKIDLLDRNSRRREISYEEGKMLAANNNMLFYETSAYTSVKVNDAFEDLLQEIYNERRRVINSNKSNGSTKILSLNNNDGNENRNCC
jgi:Rab family protein